MLKYNDAIVTLIEKIPELRSAYEADLDYYIELPYVFYEDVFTKYIIENINSDNTEHLKTIFNFIEGALQEGDESYKNLIEVSVIEALFLEGHFNDGKKLWSFVGELSKESIKKCVH